MAKIIQMKDSDGLIYPISNVYSTDEKVIGKWIDGKTLYRKVIKFVAELDKNYFAVYTGDANLVKNIDSIAKFDTFVEVDTVIVSIPNTYSFEFRTYIQRSYGGIGIEGTSSNSDMINGRNVTMILEYTKTTD